MNEFDYIDWLKKRVYPGRQTTIGIGDDCAGFRFTEGREALITTDMLLDGSCFILADAGPVAVGRKALAVNLSDIAAMAGIPKAAVINLALPRKDGANIAKGLFEGIEILAKEFDVEIIGGDTNTWNGPLAISITLFGESEGPPVRRNGAKVDDWIFVTGPLGGSILGKHLTFTPRVKEALYLARNYPIHAMIDLSDGLSRDLHHICEMSHCGAQVRRDWLPVSEAAAELVRLRRGPVDTSGVNHALHDGEDFELCFTVDPEVGKTIACRPELGTHVGFIVPEGRYELLLGPTAPTPFPIAGYEHAFE